VPPNEPIRRHESKFRIFSVIFSLALGIFGVFLCFSIIAAFFEFGGALSLPGSFFIRSYGFLAFLIPVWLFFAAYLLADPFYRPEQIFLLGSLALPFFTLSLGILWIREFDALKENSSLVAGVGKLGIGLSVFCIASLEIGAIILLRYFLFIKRKKKPAGVNAKPAPGNSARQSPTEPLSASGVFVAIKPKVAEPKVAEPKLVKPEPITQEQLPPKPPVVMPLHTESVIPESFPESLSLIEDESKNPIETRSDSAEADEDVEKALAEAEAQAAALADARAEEEAARHGAQKNVRPAWKRKSPPYFVPVEGILKQYPDGEYWIIDEDTRSAAVTLKETFKEFNIHVEVTGIRKGPVITMFEILPAPGIRLAKIEGLADNIALRLAAQSVRIVAPIPGKHAVGIEVPNAKRNIVSFREIIEGEINRDGKKPEVPIVLGKDITGEAVTVDLVQMPHLLIAGATGSGKSVCVNSMILTLLYQKPPAECRLILIDPKIVELKLYNDIPHLLTPVITEPKKAFQALQYCIYEMERRYSCLDSMGVRDIRSYNKRIKEREIAAEYMPYIVVVIDEFADLMATTGKELESTVARLAAMSRAVGIHLVLATQRPSIDIITGLIKANIPSRIAFMVASKMDSRIIIDMVGAEKLLGKGDMLYAGAVDPFPVRMQGAFVSEEEVERVVDYVKSLGGPDYIDDEIFYDDEEENADPSLFSEGEDPLYEKALEIVMQQGRASASYIQRRLKIGYNRAARLVEVMEHHGVVGPAQGSKPRELLRAP
jgi:DNA segregation ATPase FtsK/SpoIIIE, S-DNA-T family